ncbi:MAG: tryptophan-rich sensory protein [Legionella sp.]|nr:tryptophan-rich sensory protein [Legionella sp.]
MQRNDWIKLFVCILLFETIGFLLGQLTRANLYPWYSNLNKSSLTPPGVVFAIVWTFLYALLAVILWLLSNRQHIHSKKMIVLFALQMLMNWTWSIFFFFFHWVHFSAIWLVMLFFVNVFFMFHLYKSQKIIAFLLIPYLLWLMFAAYLNTFIAIMN